MAEPPLFDWKEAFRLTFGEGLSDPASLELVVCPDELLDSTDQDDMSKDLGLEVFILTLLSRVLTLKGEKFIDFKLPKSSNQVSRVKSTYLYGIVESSGSDFLSSSFIEILSPESQS